MQFAAKKGVFSTSGVPWPPALLIVVATGIGIAATSQPTRQQPRLQFRTDGRSMASAEGASSATVASRPIAAMHAKITLKPPISLPDADAAMALPEGQRIVFGSTPIGSGRAKPFAEIIERGDEVDAVHPKAVPQPAPRLAPSRSAPVYRAPTSGLHAAAAPDHAALIHAANATTAPRDVVSARITEVTRPSAPPAQPMAQAPRLRPALPAPKFGAPAIAPRTSVLDGARNLAAPAAPPPSPANAALAPAAVSADALKWIVSSSPQEDARMFGVSSASLAAKASPAEELAPVADPAALDGAAPLAAEEATAPFVEPSKIQPAPDAPTLAPAAAPSRAEQPHGADEPRPVASAESWSSVNDLAFAVPVQVNGAQAGNVVVRVLDGQAEGSGAVHAHFALCLADILDMVRPDMEPGLYARLRHSRSADALVTLETLRSLGIRAAFTTEGGLQLG